MKEPEWEEHWQTGPECDISEKGDTRGFLYKHERSEHGIGKECEMNGGCDGNYTY